MTSPVAKVQKVTKAAKYLPMVASTLAALTTVSSFLWSLGLLNNLPLRKTTGSLRASWINLAPLSDTAEALGDTLHLMATVSDQNGAVILGTQPTWSSDNPAVAKVLNDGSVVARSPGTAVIVVAVDGRTARARVVVRQKVASVRVVGDSAVTVPEGRSVILQATALDARGRPIRELPVDWTIEDTTIAVRDSSGGFLGRNAGRVVARASVEGASAYVVLTVAAAPSSLTLMGGNAQNALAGSTLAEPVVVRVLSRRGKPIEGVLVRFKPTDGMGNTDPVAALTDAEGRARAEWTLGDMPGRQTLIATVDGLDSTVTLQAEADPVAVNTRVAAAQASPSGAAAQPILEPVTIRVTDSTGRLVPNVPVSWVTLDGGKIEPLASRTDSLGEARASWTLGPQAGMQRIRVHVGSGRTVPPLLVTANVRAGAPSRAVVLSGDAQRGAVGTELSKPIVLRVVDSLDNPVADASLSLAVSAGELPDTALRTDSLGRASVRWTLGRAPGAHTMAVRVTGVRKMLTVSARAMPGAAETITFEDAPSTGRPGGALGGIVAIVRDVHGNPVPNALVRFAASSGRVAPSSAVTDSLGRAKVKWTLGTKAAEQTLTATVRGSSAKSSVEVAVQGAATTEVRQSGAPTPKPVAKPASKSSTKTKSTTRKQTSSARSPR